MLDQFLDWTILKLFVGNLDPHPKPPPTQTYFFYLTGIFTNCIHEFVSNQETQILNFIW